MTALMPDAPPRFTDTLADLFASRRAVPVGLLAAALLAGQMWFTPSLGAFVVGVILIAMFPVLAPHAWRRLFGVGRVDAPLWVRATLFVGLGVVAVAVFGWALPRALGYDATFLSAPGSLFVEPALFCVGGWGLGRDIELERRAVALERAAEQAQILALRAHLDPHFLFNTLNALAEWCRVDGAIAERGILGLAVLIRAILEAVRVPGWTLGRELELVRQLFELHRLRDPSAFDIQVAIDPALAEVQVPSLVLLPIAENAMTHGPARGARGPVGLEARVEGGRAVIAIENPGAFGTSRGADGQGLAMTRARLRHAFGEGEGGAALAVGPTGEQRTRAVVSFALPAPAKARG